MKPEGSQPAELDPFLLPSCTGAVHTFAIAMPPHWAALPTVPLPSVMTVVVASTAVAGTFLLRKALNRLQYVGKNEQGEW